MEQAKLVGVGFMGRPDRVTQLLNRLMKCTDRAYDFSIKDHNHETLLSDLRSSTGFFLGYTEKGLNLSLFKKGASPHPPKMNHRITYSMKPKEDRLH